jgi:hypothetical protein
METGTWAALDSWEARTDWITKFLTSKKTPITAKMTASMVKAFFIGESPVWKARSAYHRNH